MLKLKLVHVSKRGHRVINPITIYECIDLKVFGKSGPCITNVFATRRKNFSQWHRSFQRKLLSHWLKFLRHVAITLVIQGPDLGERDLNALYFILYSMVLYCILKLAPWILGRGPRVEFHYQLRCPFNSTKPFSELKILKIHVYDWNDILHMLWQKCKQLLHIQNSVLIQSFCYEILPIKRLYRHRMPLVLSDMAA